MFGFSTDVCSNLCVYSQLLGGVAKFAKYDLPGFYTQVQARLNSNDLALVEKNEVEHMERRLADFVVDRSWTPDGWMDLAIKMVEDNILTGKAVFNLFGKMMASGTVDDRFMDAVFSYAATTKDNALVPAIAKRLAAYQVGSGKVVISKDTLLRFVSGVPLSGTPGESISLLEKMADLVQVFL